MFDHFLLVIMGNRMPNNDEIKMPTFGGAGPVGSCKALSRDDLVTHLLQEEFAA